MFKKYGAHAGFTLLEVLLVMAVIGILTASASAIYRGFINNSELDMTAGQIIFDLRRARANAMAGEGDVKWGVHFVHSSDGNYYQIFSSPSVFSNPSTTVESQVFLPGIVVFTDPPPSSTKDVIFDKIRGTTAASTTVQITNPFGNATRTIMVNTAGVVY